MEVKIYEDRLRDNVDDDNIFFNLWHFSSGSVVKNRPAM